MIKEFAREIVQNLKEANFLMNVDSGEGDYKFSHPTANVDDLVNAVCYGDKIIAFYDNEFVGWVSFSDNNFSIDEQPVEKISC